MRLNLLVSAVAVLVAVGTQDEIHTHTRARVLPLPLLMRLGEEYFIRLDNANGAARTPPRARIRVAGSVPDSRETTVNRAIQLQLTQRLERAGADTPEREQRAEEPEREQRAEDPPISLDLTFHLLREVLEMARAEQIALQADNNRKMMDIYGK